MKLTTVLLILLLMWIYPKEAKAQTLKKIESFNFEKNPHSFFKNIVTRLSVKSKFDRKSNYFQWQFKETPKESSLLKYNLIYVFKNKDGLLNQIRLETYDCNVPRDNVNELRIKERFHNLVKRESHFIFNKPLIIKQRYYKELGPGVATQSKVILDDKNNYVNKIRLQRGFYKCDSKGGYGFRIDFFIK